MNVLKRRALLLVLLVIALFGLTILGASAATDAPQGVLETAKKEFFAEESQCSLKEAKYQCNCSREYLTSVLVSLGKAQYAQIIEEEGEVRVHCHYCNTDYEFTDEDADLLFKA